MKKALVAIFGVILLLLINSFIDRKVPFLFYVEGDYTQLSVLKIGIDNKIVFNDSIGPALTGDKLIEIELEGGCYVVQVYHGDSVVYEREVFQLFSEGLVVQQIYNDPVIPEYSSYKVFGRFVFE